MHFDYYAATLPTQVSHCHQSILSEFGGTLFAEKPVKPYKMGVRHDLQDFRVYHGGHNPLPFFVTSGDEAQSGTEFVRRLYPAHRVARADVAADFIEEGGFERITSMLDPIAESAGVRTTTMEEVRSGKSLGRTRYYGSKTSDVRVVVYEKGLERRARGFLSAPEDWYRVELRVRPRKARKGLSASLSPSELWGLSRWTGRAAETVLGQPSPEYRPDPSLRKTGTEKAVAHMLKQYGRLLSTFVEKHGREKLDEQISEAIRGAA